MTFDIFTRNKQHGFYIVFIESGNQEIVIKLISDSVIFLSFYHGIQSQILFGKTSL